LPTLSFAFLQMGSAGTRGILRKIERLHKGNSSRVRTDCKPRANNSAFSG
jgi:hypothetical protein